MDLRVEVQASTPRRLWALTRSLPPDSAVRRDGKAWLTEHELAARTLESSTLLLRQVAKALGVKFRGPEPEPVAHPDRLTRRRRTRDGPQRMSTREEIAAFFDRVAKREPG